MRGDQEPKQVLKTLKSSPAYNISCGQNCTFFLAIHLVRYQSWLSGCCQVVNCTCLLAIHLVQYQSWLSGCCQAVMLSGCQLYLLFGHTPCAVPVLVVRRLTVDAHTEPVVPVVALVTTNHGTAVILLATGRADPHLGAVLL